jgi:hypothetical protein
LDPDLLLDFHAVGVERVIPMVEVKNLHHLRLYNNKGKVYRPVDTFSIDVRHSPTKPTTEKKKRKKSLEN